MPYKEKYESTLSFMKMLDTFVPSFIQKHLGEEGTMGLQKLLQQCLKPIPENTSYEEKYNLAFDNWMLKWSTIYNFIHTHLGEAGAEEFKRIDVEALKRKSASPAIYLLKIIRLFSPGTAFSMIAKQMAYQLQVFTPMTVSELTRKRAIYTVPRCKILDSIGGEDVCLIGCQIISPKWVAEQFNTKMDTNRQDNSCVVTLSPL
jgi:hypothetical protein